MKTLALILLLALASCTSTETKQQIVSHPVVDSGKVVQRCDTVTTTTTGTDVAKTAGAVAGGALIWWLLF